MEESSAKERRMEGKKGIGGKRAGHDEDEAEARRERGEERRLVVRKGRRRENSLPPPTYAAGGSYRHGLGGPWDCQTFARPSVALGFFIGLLSTPAQFSLSLSANGLLTTYYYANNRSRIKQIVSHWVPS